MAELKPCLFCGVQKQIEVYINNNEKIKSLKEDNITGNVKRWWLYFGKRKEGAEE